MGVLVANLAVGSAIVLFGVGLALTVVAVTSYVRTRQGRLIWITLALATLAAKGAVHFAQTYQLRGEIAAGSQPFPVLLILDLVLVLALWLAVLKR